MTNIGMSDYNWHVIYNPRAGRNSASLENRIRLALDQEEVAYTWCVPSCLAECSSMIEKAVDQNARHFIAIGGDGTNHQTINTISQAGLALDEIAYGLLPWGTGNDWAEYIGLTPDLSRFVQCLKNPTFRQEQMGEVSFPDVTPRRIFTNTSGLGFDAHVVEKMENVRKWGKVSYMLQIVKSLGDFDGVEVKWQTNGFGEELSDSIFSLHLGLGPTTGGGLKVTPHAGKRKGRLALTIIKKDSKWKYLQHLPSLLTGNIGHLRFVELDLVDSLTVQSISQPILLECDGEVIGEAPFSIRIHEHQLNLLDTT